jgi:hypothetical protein
LIVWADTGWEPKSKKGKRLLMKINGGKKEKK